MRESIVVVGSINIDLVARSGRIPLAGETVSGSGFQTFPGGKGANQAVAAARLGEKTHMIGKVGTDLFGEQLRRAVMEAGVDVTGLETEDGPSGVAMITIDNEGQNAIIVVPGANGKLSAADLYDHVRLIESAAVVLTQLEIPMETVEELAVMRSRLGMPLILDPAPARPIPAGILERTDWITPNETEICTLLNISMDDVENGNLGEIAGMFQAQGIRNVALKLGRRGCFLRLQDGTETLVPAHPIRAVDTTAAGDAFNGALASCLGRGVPPVEAARWATAAAAVSVTRQGAQPSMPTRSEVESFIAEAGVLT